MKITRAGIVIAVLLLAGVLLPTAMMKAGEGDGDGSFDLARTGGPAPRQSEATNKPPSTRPALNIVGPATGVSQARMHPSTVQSVQSAAGRVVAASPDAKANLERQALPARPAAARETRTEEEPPPGKAQDSAAAAIAGVGGRLFRDNHGSGGVIAASLTAKGVTADQVTLFLEELKAFPGVVDIDLNGESDDRHVAVNDATIAGLEALPQISRLNLSRTEVTDAGLAIVARLPNLRILYLDEWVPISDAGLRHLQKLTTLQTLGLKDVNVTDIGLGHLKGMTDLHYLDLFRTHVTDAGITSLSKMKDLERLLLDFSEVTGKGLGSLTSLKELGLDGTAFNDAGAGELKALVKLEKVTLNNTMISDAGLQELGGLSHLKRLDLRGTRVTDRGVAALREKLPDTDIVH